MKLFFWKRNKKRFDLDAALTKAQESKPGEPLVLEGNPSPADMQTLGHFIEHGPINLLPSRKEEAAALEQIAEHATVRVISPSGAVKEIGSFTLESTKPAPLAAVPAPAKPRPAPVKPAAPRRSQKRPVRKGK